MKPHLFQKGQAPHNLGERHAAKMRGEKHYFTGDPCSRGHMAPRSVANGCCLICGKENMARLRLKRTPEQVEKDRAYSRESVKKWALLNKNDPRVKENKKRWKKKNLAVVRANTAQRHVARKIGTPPWVNDLYRFEIECIYKYCNALRSIGMNYHVDHIVPLRGKTVTGLHVPWNLQVIHAKENLSKGNKHHG